MKAADAIRAKIAASVEVPVHPDQKDVELKCLATLAVVINGDQAELKYSLLELSPDHFHFRDHRAVFAAMKKLSDVGDHVDKRTVRAEIGDAWADTMTAIFDKTSAGLEAETYKRRILFWANQAQARSLGQDYLAAVEKAEDGDLPGLVADLQKTVFDIAKTDQLSPPAKSEAELVDGFILGLDNPTPGYMTGFKHLQGIIRGLTPGLFVLAAPPSAGKTTFVKQLADQVAELNEAPVLFFSYEQSAAELRIKSLARLSKVRRKPISNEDIKEGKADEAKLKDAVQVYRNIGKWIKIIEGDRQHTVGRIRLMAQREKKISGKSPVIVIDYLQILPISDQGLRDKRAEVDFLVSDLRRVARELEAPVIVISSMSRAEYSAAKMSGFKESGGIEYGADIAAIMTVEDEQEGKTRTVALNIIKNRNGRRGKIGLAYDMEHDHFEEEDFSHLSYLDILGKERTDL